LFFLNLNAASPRKEPTARVSTLAYASLLVLSNSTCPSVRIATDSTAEIIKALQIIKNNLTILK